MICLPHADVLIAIGEGHLSVARSLAVKKLALVDISRLVLEYSKGAYHIGKGLRFLELVLHRVGILGDLVIF